MSTVDFQEIAALALAGVRTVLDKFLPGGKQEGAEYVVRNPTRADAQPGSFKVNINSGVWKDFASGDGGGDLVSLVAYLQGSSQGKAAKALAEFLGVPRQAPRVVATFTFHDENGVEAYWKERVEPGRDGKKKEFFFFHKERGKRKPGRGKTKHLYNLPAVLAAPFVLIAEGEKKADLLNSWGLCATALDSGAQSKLTSEMVGQLKGKRIAILPDNDEPGGEFAERTAERLHGKAASVRVVPLPGLAEKEDVLEWAAIPGNDRERLLSLIEAAPAWQPETTEAEGAPAVTEDKAAKGKRTPRIRRDEAAGIILELAEQLPLFRDDTKSAWTFINGEMVPLLSQDVEDWLTLQYLRQTGSVPSAEAMSGAKRVLSAMARQEGETIDLYNRVAWRDGAAWYDLGRGRAVRTTDEGFAVVPAVPLFKNWPHQQPHLEPLPRGNPWEFLRFCHIAEENRLLVLTTLITSFIPGIAHPIWHIQGPQGSGKSSFCRLVKRIVDPSAAELQIVQPERETDLFLLLYHNYLVALDNMSGLNGRISDILCGASTGTAVSQRAMYTNLDTIMIRLKNIVLLNGIVPLVSRADLLDRTITIHLDRIPDDGRREERHVMEEFDAAIPQILGGIFSTLAKAMAIYPTVRLETLPRLADFARWGYSVAEALGGHGARFLADFGANATAQGEEVLGQSTLALALLAYMEERETWETTVGQAYSVLLEAATPAKGDNTFPGKPQDMRRYLERLRVTLADAGITYQFGHRSREGVPLTFSKKAPESHSSEIAELFEERAAITEFGGG